MDDDHLRLEDGSQVGVIGGGPAGSFFSYFLLESANRLGIDISIDVYEPRVFSNSGPAGCNMCGGIISESLVQMLATEGISLPTTIVQRGIDSYHLHMDVGSVLIKTPLLEKRIGAVHRGSGPRDIKEIKWGSFDGYLQSLAEDKGANVVHERVSKISNENGKLQIDSRAGSSKEYDLLAVATGVNGAADRLFKDLDIGYEPPQTTKAVIKEYFLGEERIEEVLGNSMHVFLLDIPRLEFAAIIPKGDYASLCLLGDDIDNELLDAFLTTPEVSDCLPIDLDLDNPSCWCSPRISTKGAKQPTADRVVFIGDCGSTRLYKDGIGAAYRTAKAAATTAVFQGISAKNFQEYYWPACENIESDNRIGKVMFLITRLIQSSRLARHAVLSMTSKEQSKSGNQRRMSMVLWDMFTGSSPYKDIFLRTLRPGFWVRLFRELAFSVIP